MEMNIKKVITPTPGRGIVIAGPCSAETEGQVMQCAKDLAKLNQVDLFRSGIWKPRTRPGSFEGVGTEGLSWLKRVKEETGLKTTTEVAKASHVYDCLKAGIDVLWLGARTTVNPFSVQEVADALSGADVPVMIKNPINPDLGLWIGAVERIYKAGITRIGLIHRGFSYHGETNYRNVPRWQMAIEMKRRFPDLQMVVDNSHICGNRHMLAEVAQEALNLNYDGLMTEVHPRPDEAWSDAAQQITPSVFGELLQGLRLRKPTVDEMEMEPLTELRRQIDEIDNDLIGMIGRRMKLSDQIGEFKAARNIAVLQESRWEAILQEATKSGKKHGLSKEFMESYLRAIHQESIDHQDAIVNKAV
ncbi:chorismate mutase [Lewinella aquimaris]|uniref:chorismate mutase n=1 Tax=Neolewinella aquimaris TaxID=1835722 RepID=A0A840E1V0_9BACT|nr:chorismate mutase [Neolewinella aquimaris]MBB4077685.1 chorismate mutase [Neolewinella aquimaris]